MDFIKNFFGNKPDQASREKIMAKSDKVSDRLKLANDKNTSQEILYFLAEHDPNADVRKAVAHNRSTPIHASVLLAKDNDIDVRLTLAERLIHLLPDLSIDKQSQLYSFAIQALGTLALDEVLKIRLALSSALKDHAHAPPKVAGQLARDLEREVSEPVLRLCVALSDEDLLEILKSHPASWAVQAIATRPVVTERISQAVIDCDDEPSGYLLLENKGANISLKTLGEIVEKAKQFPTWQKSTAKRKSLPKELALELASFVDDTVRNLLLERTNYNADEMNEIATVVKRRMNLIDQSDESPDAMWSRIVGMIKTKQLTDQAMQDAIAVRNRTFVIKAFAALCKTPEQAIEQIFELKAPKPIVAICHMAGFSMRTAFLIQKEMLLIQPKELIYPRGGTDYPLDEKEIRWQLEYLGLAGKG
jgi:uncharacterized protein (DUF2336 family)